MTQTKEYLILLGKDARKRHRHQTIQGQVIAFMVQLEVRHDNIWKAVVRYDSSHGFSHKNLYNLKEERKKLVLNLSFDDALTLADSDINENWEAYIERFLIGLFP